MAKAMPAATEGRSRRQGPGTARGPNPASAPDGVGFLIVKNGLFWGSIVVSGGAIYTLVSLVF